MQGAIETGGRSTGGLQHPDNNKLPLTNFGSGERAGHSPQRARSPDGASGTCRRAWEKRAKARCRGKIYAKTHATHFGHRKTCFGTRNSGITFGDLVLSQRLMLRTTGPDGRNLSLDQWVGVPENSRKNLTSMQLQGKSINQLGRRYVFSHPEHCQLFVCVCVVHDTAPPPFFFVLFTEWRRLLCSRRTQ